MLLFYAFNSNTVINNILRIRNSDNSFTLDIIKTKFYTLKFTINAEIIPVIHYN